MGKKGFVYVFTGDGKGKTSAALGVSLRALLSNKKVCWISWYKEDSWKMSEQGLAEKFADNLEMYWAGKGFFMGNSSVAENVDMGKKVVKRAKVNNSSVFDTASEGEHRDAAVSAMELAFGKINDVWLLVLDEILNAVGDGLVSFEEVKRLVESRGKTHVVLTGRSKMKEVEEIADLVSQIVKIKHPFDSGGLAVKGLDF